MDANTKELTGQMTLMPRMRRMSGKVLTMWLASWLLLMLQPCCESVAGSLPHGHESPPPGYQHDDGHAHHEIAVDNPLEHKHCDSDSEQGKYLLDTTSKENFNFDQKKLVQIPLSEVNQLPLVLDSTLTLAHVAQSPLLRRQTYLVTQRFRI
jgi:hypothetical protein